MAHQIQLLDNNQGILRTFSGTVTAAEFLASVEEVLTTREAISRYRYSLLDFMAVDEVDVAIEDVKDVLKLNQETDGIMPHLVVAICGTSDVVFGLARMWEAYAESLSWKTGVFRQRAQAEEWIREQMKQLYDLEVGFC